MSETFTSRIKSMMVERLFMPIEPEDIEDDINNGFKLDKNDGVKLDTPTGT